MIKSSEILGGSRNYLKCDICRSATAGIW